MAAIILGLFPRHDTGRLLLWQVGDIIWAIPKGVRLYILLFLGIHRGGGRLGGGPSGGRNPSGTGAGQWETRGEHDDDRIRFQIESNSKRLAIRRSRGRR